MKYRQILVPVDFSKYSEKAVDYAAELALRDKAEIVLLHVATLLQSHLEREFPVYDLGQFDAIHKSQIEEHMQPILDGLKERGIKASPQIITGYAEADQIIDFIDEYKPDLVVMGTHGRSGLTHLLMGSIAEKVVRMSRVPVLTVHHEWEFERTT
ncbi:MAG TPA: universal stress protein [Calditrichia bacterium]|nr:universal stress protein [Calditrichota bacterium]HQV30972.1 universal stress protein [Calditrichia bacterium]